MFSVFDQLFLLTNQNPLNHRFSFDSHLFAKQTPVTNPNIYQTDIEMD